MTLAQIRSILINLVGNECVNNWSSYPNISKINLVSDGNIFYSDNGSIRNELYLDTDNSLLLTALVKYTATSKEIINIQGIYNIDIVTSIETLNPYSESVFVGQRAV